MADTFDAHDPDRETAPGTLGDTSVVNSVGQTGLTLALDGRTADVANGACLG